MTDFEREDLELKQMLGDRFIDETTPISEATPKEVKNTSKQTPKPETKEAPDSEWHPIKKRTWMDSLVGCVKWMMTFGGLNMLIFYWQMSNLMDESIAVPCMWVCCALAGYGVGLNIWRGRK